MIFGFFQNLGKNFTSRCVGFNERGQSIKKTYACRASTHFKACQTSQIPAQTILQHNTKENFIIPIQPIINHTINMSHSSATISIVLLDILMISGIYTVQNLNQHLRNSFLIENISRETYQQVFTALSSDIIAKINWRRISRIRISWKLSN